MILTGVPRWQLVLFACNLVAFATLLARIVFIRLASSYPALVVWVAANVVLGILPWIVPMDMLAYYWFYICEEGLTLILYLFTVLELYSRVLKDLPGLDSLTRIAIPVIAGAATVVSTSLLAFEARPVSYLAWLYRVDRTVITTMVVFVLMITAFLVWFPIRVSRNTVVYSVGYAAYMVPKGASLFLMNSGHGTQWLSGVIGMTMSVVCLLFWAIALEREGETTVVSAGILSRPEEEARLLMQLETINRSLLRAGK